MKMKKKSIKPEMLVPCYYGEFKCIAGRCRHNCCIGWEICIDDAAYEKYKKNESIFKTIERCDEGAFFTLKENGRCPHLTDSGLCEIIISHGEDMLSEICKNHPRFFNPVGKGRVEAGLGIVCEEACRLILEHPEPFSLLKTNAYEAPEVGKLDCGFDPIPDRDRIISMIHTEGKSFDERLAALRREFGISKLGDLDKWLDRLLELEILEERWAHDLRSAKGRLVCRADKANRRYDRLLTYFVFRHVSMAQSAENLRARLAFAMLSSELIRALFESSERLDYQGEGEADAKSEQASENGIEKAADMYFEKQTSKSKAHRIDDTDSAPRELIEWARRYSAEIEYSEDNTAELIFTFESEL